MISFNRRDFFQRFALSGLGAGLLTQAEASTGKISKKGFSFLHLTDMHVRRKRQGHAGYEACIDTVNRRDRFADFSLMGGDLAFDGNYTAKEEFIDQIDLYKKISDKLQMPYYNSIGNHDVLGWNSRRKVSTDDADLGKKLIQEKLNMKSTYYSFNHKGWHFVVMDSIHPVMADHGPSYKAAFGEEQLDWLRFDLGRHHGMPTVIMTHIAVFCHIALLNGDPKYNPIGHMVVEDTLAFRHIIERHHVKVVLQGHSHVPEDYFHNGIWYITSQSVSAAWWGGNWKGFLPGYTVFHTKGDSLTWEKKTFPWEHQLEPDDTLERERIAQRNEFEQSQESLKREELNKAVHSD
jgi:3',5'-cyclic-AMP phosphodiesterase